MKNRYFTELGLVCPYCGTETEDVCCGEMHHEMGFIEVDEQGKEIGTHVLLFDDLNKYQQYKVHINFAYYNADV